MRIDANEFRTALVMDNAGELALMCSVIDFWQRRYHPVEDYVLQRIPNNIVQELNEAWKAATEKENE